MRVSFPAPYSMKTPIRDDRRFCVRLIFIKLEKPANTAGFLLLQLWQLPDAPHHFSDDLQVQ